MLQRGCTFDCSANTRATCNANPLLQLGGLAAGPTARLSRPLLASGSRTRRATAGPCPWALPASSRGAQRPTSKPQSGSNSKAASKRAPHGGAAPQEPAAQPGSTTTPSTPSTPTSSSTPSAAGRSPVEGLNEEQLVACLADAPVARVKAGPGSGKTRVVVARVQHLVAERGVPPHRILAITFTNKAANELKERLAAAGCGVAEAAAAGSGAGGGGGGPVAKTFHGLGAWMLRQSVPAAPQLGVTPSFKVLDADQSDKLMRRAVREVEQLQQQAAGGGGGGGSSAVSGAGDSSASSNSSNSRSGSSSSGDGSSSSSSSSSRPLPVALPALPADELTSRAVAILGERLSDLIPDLKMRLAAAAPTVPEGRELDAAARLPAAEPGQARAQAALPPAAPEASRVARGVDDKAAGDKRAVAARWHRKQVQAYICMYQRLLREHNAFDFSDLIAQPVRLLAARPDLAAGWRRRFDHILVDEFQDTDPAQYELIKLLLRPPSAPSYPGTHLFVVGDPDQAIYGWRGAEVGHMRDLLPRDFPHTATFLMSTNYRSDPHIVAAADKVLWAGQPTTSPRSSSSSLSPARSSSSSSSAQARELYKAPVPARPPSAAGAAAVLRRLVFPDPQAEARWVAGRVVGWANSGELGPRGARRLGEVAVLYRNRDMSRPLEEALTLRGVPYTVVGGQPFWSYADVADAVAYLHILMDPLRCDVFLERVINEPKRGLGDTSLDKLRTAARERRSTLSRLIFEDCLQGADGGSSSSSGDSSSSSGDSSSSSGGSSSSSGSSGSIGGVAAESAAAAPLALAGGLVREDWVLSPELATVEGAAGIAASFAPEVGEGSPLHAIKLTKAAKQGLQSLRGLLVCLRRMAARGAAVSELLAAALALSGYRAALLQAEAEGAGRKAASSKKKTVAEEASERLERLAQLQELAASPGVWVTHDDPLEPQPGGQEAAAAGEVELAGEPGEDAQRPSASSSASEAPAPQEPGPTAATAGAAVVSRGLAGVGRFLEHAALVTGADMADSGGGRGGRGGRGSGSGAVRLMTLHASKGLEFQRVFIVGVEDGLLPSARSAADPHRLGEERRLFYVGVTRAKDQLFLCRCKQRLVYGRPEALQPSPFLRHLQLKEEVLQ